MQEAQPGQVVWDGRVGDAPLKVEVQSNGRIAASWRTSGGNDRRVVVNTIEELERTVLFQLMLTAGPADAHIPQEITRAVNEARVGLPDPTTIPRSPKKRRRPPRRQGPRPRRR